MIDIREHSGAYGAGKYRKNTILTEGDLQVISMAGANKYPVVETGVYEDLKVIRAADGYIYAIGLWQSSTFVGGLRIIKLTETFSVVSTQNIPTAIVSLGLSSPSIGAAIISNDMHLYISGMVSGASGTLYKVDLLTNTLVWKKVEAAADIYACSLEIMPNGNILAGFYSTSTSIKAAEVISPAGAVLLTIPAQGANQRYATSDNEGNIYIAVNYRASASTHAITAKYNSAGTKLWEKTAAYFSYGMSGILFNRVVNRLYVALQIGMYELDKDTGNIIKVLNSGAHYPFAGLAYDQYGNIFFPCQFSNTFYLDCYLPDFTRKWQFNFNASFAVYGISTYKNYVYAGQWKKAYAIPIKSEYKLL